MKFFLRLSILTMVYFSFILILFIVEPNFINKVSVVNRIIVLFPFLVFILFLAPISIGMYTVNIKREYISLKNGHFIIYILLVLYTFLFYLGGILKLITKIGKN